MMNHSLRVTNKSNSTTFSINISLFFNLKSSSSPFFTLMANSDLTSSLLQPSSDSDTSELIITVDESETPQHNNPSYQFQSNSNPHHQVLSHDDDDDPYKLICKGDDFVLPKSTTVDPFRNHTRNIEGVYEWIKILVCIPIAVIRLVLFGLSLMIGYVATKLALQGWKDRQSPMPRWRCRIMWVTRFCTRVILFSFGYHWIRRKGRPAPRSMAPIVVSNHVSFIEPIFFFYELFPTIVTAEAHDSLPFVGTIIRAMQVIYVSRFSPSSRKHAVSEIKRKASIDRFPRVLLFPEGTTSNGKVLMSFQLGAFIPGFPIQPVVVRFPHVHFDQSWGHISLVKLMFRMFTQFHNFMEIEYLPVILPLQNKKENAVNFSERTSYAMSTALNVVQTSHSYGDLMLLTRASHFGQKDPYKYMVEMARFEALYHMSTLETMEFLDKFLLMNPNPSGFVGMDDFSKVLKLKPCALSEKIFRFLDVENNGVITFPQFLFGSVHVLKQPVFRQACELAFAECDVGGNDYISEQEFGDTIRRVIPDLNNDERHELFNMFDTDNDENISKSEFLTCLRKNPLLIALFSPISPQDSLIEAVIFLKRLCDNR